jgi:cytochrome b561
MGLACDGAALARGRGHSDHAGAGLVDDARDVATLAGAAQRLRMACGVGLRSAGRDGAAAAVALVGRRAAVGGHVLLYLFTFATALVGWALAGTMRVSLNKDLFGIPVLPIYVNQDRAVHGLLENTHRYLAYTLAALVAVHVAAALRHHFIKRNDVLRRMLRPAAQSA